MCRGPLPRRRLLPRLGGTPTPRVLVLLRVQSGFEYCVPCLAPQLALTEKRDVAQTIIPRPGGMTRSTKSNGSNEPEGTPMTPRLTQREMAELAKQRPKNWDAMDAQMQWAIDLELGILDWDGTDGRHERDQAGGT
jgi:hypothetical protein